jgi:hypothetical protein
VVPVLVVVEEVAQRYLGAKCHAGLGGATLPVLTSLFNRCKGSELWRDRHRVNRKRR